MIKAFSYYRQPYLRKILINLFGKPHIEKDEIFTYEGKIYNKLFFYSKQYMNIEAVNKKDEFEGDKEIEIDPPEKDIKSY